MAGISSFPWYHGSISRLQTEHLLQEHRLNGSYLVRDSENIKGAYVLCVWCDGQIYQYRILPTAAGKFQMKYANNVRGDTYSNVSELISSVSTHGLYCSLRNPVPVAKEDDVDSDDDDEDERTASTDSNSYSTQEQASRLLLARLNQMDISSLDREYVDFVNNYVTALMESDFSASSMKDMPQLKTMLEYLGRPLKREADYFLIKMKVLHSLFDLKRNPTQKYKYPRAEADIKLTELLKGLANCQNEVRAVEKTAYSCFQTLSLSDPALAQEPLSPQENLTSPLEDRKGDSFGSSSYQPTELLSEPISSVKSQIAPLPVYHPQHFEVRQEGRNVVEALKSNKMKLTVNVTQGFLTINLKDEIVSFKQDTIAQLVKSRDNKTRLMIAFNNGKKKEYSFEHTKQREYFCQLVQSMKLYHTNSKEVDQISVFIGTWNMGDAPPPSNFLSWLLCQGDGKQRDKNIPFLGYDLYVIGTQESSLSDRDWLTRVKKAISQITPGSNKEYHVVTLSSLWGIRLTVLIKPDHQHRISNVRTSSVKTGIANALALYMECCWFEVINVYLLRSGNKGAVGVSFYFSNTSFCFINCHLTSGTEKMLRRNQNYYDILKGLNLGSKGLSVFDLTNQFHHVYFLGDLNYRVEWNVQDILQHITKKDYSTLLKYDQLLQQQNEDEVLVGFSESDITFPPTYRYELGLRSVYAYKKIKKTKIRINEPSWCDRVLWRSYPGTYNENTTYGCSKDVVTSDHSPVFATFLVGIMPPSTIAEVAPENKNITISFSEVEATIMTTMCGRKFLIEFHSSCLEAKVVSKTNEDCEKLTNQEVRPVWKAENLPELVPIFPDSSYLEDQHILLSLKSEDSDESYGECVVELKDKFTSHYVRFSTILTHHGHKTGYLRGQMHIKAKDESLYGSAKKIRTYELISFDDPNKIQYYGSDTAASMFPPTTPATTPLDQYTGTRVKAQAIGMARALPWTREGVTPVPPPKKSSKSENSLTSPQTHTGNSPSSGATHTSKDSSPGVTKIMPSIPPPLPPPRAPSPNIQESMSNSTVYEVKDSDVQLSPMSKRAPFPSPSKPTPKGNRNGVTGSPSKPWSSDGATSEEEVPPIPEKKSAKVNADFDNDDDVYDTIRRPTTISQWLMDLGLPQYIHGLVENGWDNMDFINDLTENDLSEASVNVPSHRQKILLSIANMTN